jgi:hypothetical protein
MRYSVCEPLAAIVLALPASPAGVFSPVSLRPIVT